MKQYSREKLFALACLVLGIAVWVHILMLVAGCTRKPKTAEPTMTVEPRWCMNLAGKWKGEDAQGTICISIAEACDFARVMALKYGSFGKISVVGECRDADEEVEP